MAEGTKTDAAILVEVALAEFEEAAERLHEPEAAAHRLATQRVQDNVDAFASRQAHDIVGKAQRAAVEYRLDAEISQQGTLGGRAGGREYARATVERILYGG